MLGDFAEDIFLYIVRFPFFYLVDFLMTAQDTKGG